MEIYLDNSATTMCYPDVAELTNTIMTQDYGNPSSMHHKGLVAERYVRSATEKIAATLRADSSEILFTSGGTESDNLALIGTARANVRMGRHLITTGIEHPAILETMKYLESEGFEVTCLPVDENGIVRLEDLENAIRSDTILVSMMYVNNEIGAVEPIAEAGALIKRVNPRTIFHVDAVQGYGKFRICPKNMGIDLMSVSGHKIHGPKGVGFLYIRSGAKISPILYGGGQQKGMRSGTENVPGIAGLARAAEEIYSDFDKENARMRDLKNYFVHALSEKLEDIRFNGKTNEESAPHIISVSIRGVRAEVLLHALEDREIYVSAGSACASNRPHVSETLKAIHLENELLESTLRLSMSVFTTKEQMDYTIQALCDIVPMLRRYSRQ